MKLFIAICGIFVAAVAKPSGIATPLVAPVAVAGPVAIAPVSSQFLAQDALGQYSYGYSTALSAKSEARSANGLTVGGYTYVDGGGKLQSVEYSSDSVNGFRVAATNLPVPPALPAVPALPVPVPVEDTPEVVEARTKHLAAFEEVKTRSTEIITPVAAVPTLPVRSLLPIVPAAPVVTLKSASAATAVEVKSGATSATEAPAATTSSEAPLTEAPAPAAAARLAATPAGVTAAIAPTLTVNSIVAPALPVASAPFVAAPVAYGYSLNTIQGLNTAILTQPAITTYTVPLGAQLLAGPVSGSTTSVEQGAAAKEAKESSD